MVHAVATDGSASAPVYLDIFVDMPHDGRAVLAAENFSIDENASVGSVIGRVTVVTPGDSPITAYHLSGEGSDEFTIDQNGTIRLGQEGVLDFEQRHYRALYVSATNMQGESSPVGIGINIRNIPDTPAQITRSIYRVAENVPQQTVIGSVEIRRQADSPIDAFVCEGDDCGYFTIDTNGTIRLAEGVVPDYEFRTHYRFAVRAHSAAGYSNRVEEEIYVENLPDSLPTLTWQMIQVPDENETQRIKVGSVIVTSEDAPILSLQLGGSGSDKFVLDANGTLWTKENAGFDYETIPAYTLYVRAVTTIGESDPLRIMIPIGNVQERPVLESFYGQIDENVPAGSVVGQVTVRHAGDSPVVSYRISGQLGSAFVIDANGTIRTSGQESIDYERRVYYSFNVYARNQNGHESDATWVAIDVNNLPDEPVIDSNMTCHVEENATAGTVIGRVEILRSGDSPIDHFENLPESIVIDTNGTIRLAVDHPFDYERQHSIWIYPVAVNRNGNRSNSIELSIAIDNIPDEPALKEDQRFVIDENSPAGTKVGTVEVLYPGDSPIVNYEIVNGNSTLFGVDTNGTIFVKDSGRLDYESQTNFWLVLRVQNKSGKYSLPVGCIISLNNLPDEPRLPDNQSFDADENISAGAVIGRLVIESTGDSPMEAITLSGYGAEHFVVDTNGTLRLAPNSRLDYEEQRSYRLTLMLQNQTGNVVWRTLAIYVNNIPDEPILGNAQNCTVMEHAPAGSEVCSVPIVEPGDTPIVSMKIVDDMGNTAETPFEVDLNGTIRVKKPLALDYERTPWYNLYIVATNASGKHNRRYLPRQNSPWHNGSQGAVSIFLQNDPYDVPMLRRKILYVDENASVGKSIGNVLSNQGKAPVSDASVLDAFTGKPSRFFDIDLNGTIHIKSPLDYEKYFKPCRNSVDVKRYCEYVDIHMGNLYGTGVLYRQEIEIGDVPDTPAVLTPKTFVVAEDAPVGEIIGRVPVVEQGQAAVKYFEIAENGRFGITDAGDIIVKSPLDYETRKRYDLNVTAYNGYATSDPVTVTILVTDVPDTVPILNDTQLRIRENAKEATVVGDVDIANEGDRPISSMHISGAGSEMFTIDLNGTIRVASGALLDYETQPHYQFQVVASNEAGESLPAIVTVDLENIQRVILYDYSGSIDENSPVGTVVGKIPIDFSEGSPQSILLTGQGSDYFQVDANGTIRVSQMGIDYETMPQFMLKAQALNSWGSSNQCDVNITVRNLSESVPKFVGTTYHVTENSPAGTIVGSITILSDGPLRDVNLSGAGADAFTISHDGVIRVAPGASLDYEKKAIYRFSVEASNAFGTGSKTVTVYIDNVPDTPPHINVYGVLAVEDGQDSSTPVGYGYRLGLYSDSSVDSVRLEGKGASDFTISKEGILSVAEGITIDRNQTKKYHLKIIAGNQFGVSDANVTVEVYCRYHTLWSPSLRSADITQMAEDENGSYYLAGMKSIYIGRNSYRTPFIAKFNASEKVEWIKDFDVSVSGTLWGEGVQHIDLRLNGQQLCLSGTILGNLTGADKVLVAGELGQRDLYSIFLDRNGTLQEKVQYGTLDNDTYVSMVSQANGCVIASNSDMDYDPDHNSTTNSSAVLYRFDSNGTLKNAQQFEISMIDRLHSFVSNSDNHFYTMDSDAGYGSTGLLVLDSLFSPLEHLMLDRSPGSEYRIIRDAMGNIYMVEFGYSNQVMKTNSLGSDFQPPATSLSAGNYSNLILHKYTPSGVEIWKRNYTLSEALQVTDLKIDAEGLKVIGTDYTSGRIIVFDGDGAQIDDRRYGIEMGSVRLFLLQSGVFLYGVL
jgi:hypothetical protein